MKRYKQLKEQTEDFYLAIAEYVGANEQLDISKYKNELKPYIRKYQDLYRIWQEYTLEEYERKNKKIMIKPRSYFATTRALGTISELGDELYIDNALVSIHSGKGFDPIQILKDGLKSGIIQNEVSFVQSVILDNKYQKEILLLDSIKKLDESNVMGVYNNGAVDFI